MNIKDSVKILTEFKIYSQILYRSEVVKYISPLLSHSRLCSLVDSSLLSVPFLFSLELRKLFSNAHCVRDYQKHCQTRSHIGRDAMARKILAVAFMTFDPLIIGRATMEMRTKITFTAWREVWNRLKKTIIGHGDVLSFLIISCNVLIASIARNIGVYGR